MVFKELNLLPVLASNTHDYRQSRDRRGKNFYSKSYFVKKFGIKPTAIQIALSEIRWTPGGTGLP